jgi:predicted glycosyltransferase
MRLIVYSHDAYGLGNIRRMLAICKYLLETTPDLSILLISGSPVVHSFRMPQGLDYIKLPCLGRDEKGELSTKFLGTNPQEAIKLRSDLIKSTIASFQPDLILVDKKPYGLQGELKPAIDYLKQYLPETKLVLLLRDILDTPTVTIADWKKNGYYDAIERDYDQVLVVGMPEVFDVVREYNFSGKIANKTQFCGYIRRENGFKSSEAIRQELGVKANEKLVLVTPGGGGDGYQLVKNYLQGLKQLPKKHNIKSLIISGPEMPQDLKQELDRMAQQFPHVQISEFTDDIASYMEAADAVVCMGGYNTVCEVLSLSKKVVIVPRVNPVQEQWIRAKNMADFGLFKAIHPDSVTPQNLMETVLEELQSNLFPAVSRLDLDALPRIQRSLCDLVFGCYSGEQFFTAAKSRYLISVM